MATFGCEVGVFSLVVIRPNAFVGARTTLLGVSHCVLFVGHSPTGGGGCGCKSDVGPDLGGVWLGESEVTGRGRSQRLSAKETWKVYWIAD